MNILAEILGAALVPKFSSPLKGLRSIQGLSQECRSAPVPHLWEAVRYNPRDRLARCRRSIWQTTLSGKNSADHEHQEGRVWKAGSLQVQWWKKEGFSPTIGAGRGCLPTVTTSVHPSTGISTREITQERKRGHPNVSEKERVCRRHGLVCINL